MARKIARNVKLAEATPAFRELVELTSTNAAQADAIQNLQESLADVKLALDNVGWRPMGEDADMRELPLSTIKAHTQVTRALAVINPLIKRGISVRTAYIWGNGITLDGIDSHEDFAALPANSKYLLSEKAQMELESCLATDGNFFLLLTKPGKGTARGKAKAAGSVQRIPMWQITGQISNPENSEEIWFYRREWNTVTTNAATEQETVKNNIVYYPAADYDEAYGKPSQFRGKQVIWDSAIAAHSVNKQVGWRWGVPDLLPVMFWAKAHKEFLENQATLVKAYSRFAFKVTSPTANGTKSAATKIGTAPTLDPMTGEPQSVGGTAVMGMGTTISSLGRTGGSVDFKAGLPLAGYVAAGLGVPLNELTADAGEANRASAETLSSSNEKVMKARQAEHIMFFNTVFAYLGFDIKVSFPKIEEEATYRRIQSITSLLPLNVFSDVEIRRLIVRAMDLQDFEEGKVPTEEELGNLILAAKQAADQAKMAADAAAKAPAVPGGVPGKPAAGAPGTPKVKQAASKIPSYGDNSYRKDAQKAAR